MERDPEQVGRPDVARRQRPVERPGLLAQRGRDLRRHPDAPLGDRVDFPVAPERCRQERHRPVVPGAEREQRVAVAPPPFAPGRQPHAPGPDPRGVQDVPQAGRGGRRTGTRGDPEIDPLAAADHAERVRERRVLDAQPLIDRQVVDVEQPLAGGLLGRVAAGRLRSLQVRVVDDGEAAVDALEREGGRVEGRERG